MQTIKEYANTHNQSIQSIYQAIKSKKAKEQLKGHIKKVGNIMYLDDVAIEYLETRSKKPVIVVKENNKELLEKAQIEKEQLKNELLINQKEIIERDKKILENIETIAQLKIEIVELKKELEIKEKENQERKKGLLRRIFNK